MQGYPRVLTPPALVCVGSDIDVRQDLKSDSVAYLFSCDMKKSYIFHANRQ